MEKNWMNVSIPKALHEKAKQKYAAKGFTNVSQLIQHAIRVYLKENQQ